MLRGSILILFVVTLSSVLCQETEDLVESQEARNDFCNANRVASNTARLTRANLYNYNCAIKCGFSRGLFNSQERRFNVREGENCEKGRGYKCKSGQCGITRTVNDRDDNNDNENDKVEVKVTIKSADITAANPASGQLAKEVFVVVKAVDLESIVNKPARKICTTRLDEDGRNPVWNHHCPPAKMTRETILKFELYDRAEELTPVLLGSVDLPIIGKKSGRETLRILRDHDNHMHPTGSLNIVVNFDN